MLRIRNEHARAMNSTVMSTLPERFLAALGEKGIKAERDEKTCAVSITDSRGYKTTQLFNETGAPAATVLPSGAKIEYEHAPGNPFSRILYPNGERVDLGRDQQGNLSSISYLEQFTYELAHDTSGRLERVTYPDESSTRFVYGPAGLEQYIDRTGAVTTFKTDEVEGRHSITDALGRSMVFLTGVRGQLTRILFPDGTTQETLRGDDGAIVGLRRRDGECVRYESRAADSLAMLWPDGTRTDYNKGKGTLVLSNSTDELRIVEDDQKQPVREETSAGIVGYSYDGDGRLSGISTPWGDTVTYDYDADGRLCSIRDWDGVETRIQRTILGAICAIEYGNGQISERRHIGRLGLVEQAQVFDVTGLLLSDQSYTYDACDRLIAVRDVWGAGENDQEQKQFIHDAEGRLLAEVDPHTEKRRFEYDYDVKGNLTYDDGKYVRYGKMDEVLEHDGRELEYDAVGNVTRIPGRDNDMLVLAWAGDGTLSSVTHGRGQVRFSYDALGRRCTKRVGQGLWRYGWSGTLLLWEEWTAFEGAVPVRRDYLYLPDGTPLAFREQGKTYWLQTDPRGAVIRAFDAEGNVVWRARYEPFGAAHVEVALVRQPLRLSGQYEDEETGLHYNFARYYCPWLKTYLSLDPNFLCFGATNYSYARNDPINRADPRGALAFLAVLAVIGIGALVGGVISAATEYFFGHGSILGAFANGAITGAFTAGLGLLGPWGAVAGGAIGSFFGTLVEGAINGQGWCWKCALRAAGTSIVIDLLTFGLGKIPIVKKFLEKAKGQLDDLLKKAKGKLDDLLSKAKGKFDDLLSKFKPKPKTKPTGTMGGKPSGTPAKIKPQDDAVTQRSLTRENETAEVMANAGYKIEQNPNIPGTTKNPDYLIEGKVFDNIAPETANPRNIAGRIEEKVVAGQTQRVVLNLDDSAVDLGALKSQLTDYPINGLEEVIVVKNGQITHFYP